MTLVYKIIEASLVRSLTRFVLRIFSFFDRWIGLIRFKALVKNSGRYSFYNSKIDIKYGNNIVIGDHTLIGPYTTLGAKAKITIGSYVRISKGVLIETAGLDLSISPPYKHNAKEIVIGDGVWIASNAIILGGVTIGDNVIIGAGAVITKDIPKNSIVVGQAVRILEKKTQ
jgi:acetyltransferase-like isoleucine patch superfamily enzyme